MLIGVRVCGSATDERRMMSRAVNICFFTISFYLILFVYMIFSSVPLSRYRETIEASDLWSVQFICFCGLTHTHACQFKSLTFGSNEPSQRWIPNNNWLTAWVYCSPLWLLSVQIRIEIFRNKLIWLIYVNTFFVLGDISMRKKAWPSEQRTRQKKMREKQNRT